MQTALNISVQEGQSLIDIALQVYGGVEGVFTLASENGLSITDSLEPGQVLVYDERNTVNKKVVAYYAEHSIMPATEISEEDGLITQSGGIGFMGIGIDFIVS